MKYKDFQHQLDELLKDIQVADLVYLHRTKSGGFCHNYNISSIPIFCGIRPCVS